jgi:hypothetical protein
MLNMGVGFQAPHCNARFSPKQILNPLPGMRGCFHQTNQKMSLSEIHKQAPN